MLALNRNLLPTVFLLLIYCSVFAQQKQKVDRCGTVGALQKPWNAIPL